MGTRWTKIKRAAVATIPSIVIFGTAPQYFLLWGAWRSISVILPDWIYQFGDDIAFSSYQRMILFFFEHLTGVEIYLHGDAAEIVRKKESVAYLSNHQSTMDWMVSDMLAVRQGSLGHLRFVMKDSLQLIPLYGHYFYQHGCIFVKRRNFNSRKMIASLNYLKNSKINTWLVIFPEGTRFNPDNTGLLEKNKKFAVEQGLEPLEHVLNPKHRGLQLALEELGQRFDAVYDVTIAYSNTFDCNNRIRINSPSFFEFLSCISPEVHLDVRRIEIADIPYKDESLFKVWLHNLFVEKDRKMESLLTKSKEELSCKGTLSRLPLKDTLFCILFYTAISLPLIFTSKGRRFYLNSCIASSVVGYTWLLIRSVA